MSINNRLINAGGGPPQPEGTGAFLLTGANGMYISVDDGVTWSNNAFTGIDPTNGFNKEIVWNGSAFVAFQSGGKFFTSPDGYNWTETYSNSSFGDLLGMSVDRVSGEIIAVPYTYNVSYIFLRSLDNGNTWTQQGGPFSSQGAYVQGVAVNNGYAVASGRSGNWRRTGVNNSWGYTSTTVGTESYPVHSNGTWSMMANKTNQKVHSSTSASPGYVKDWSISAGGGNTLSATTKPAVDNLNAVCMYVYYSGSYKFLISYNKGLSYSVAGFSSSVYSAVGYHNGKFYYNRNNELWYWVTPPFGAQVKVRNLGLQCANFASNSFIQ